MTKLRRGGYVFFTWKGDHAPRHVHVWKNGRLVLKWNLEEGCVLKGSVNARLLRILSELVREGRL